MARSPSDEETAESSHGYSSENEDEDSFTYYTKETMYTKDTYNTYFTSDETVSPVERVVMRLANMFVCDFEPPQQRRRR